MTNFNISISINLIKDRIKKIKKYKKECKNKLSKVYEDAIIKNLIEIGEESKNLNKHLFKKNKRKDFILSKTYNLRISLTHYYMEMGLFDLEKYLKYKFPKFIRRINELYKEVKKWIRKPYLKK